MWPWRKRKAAEYPLSFPLTTRDALIGCLLGGALGDAIGFAHEGRAPGPVGDLEPGDISDDTQLTLATCEALTASKGRVDPQVIGDHFVRWHREHGLRGVGAATAKAINELRHGGHWALVGRKGEMAAGNGAAIRVAPLAFVLDPDDPKARRAIRDVSRITHHSDEAYTGALGICIAVHDGAVGRWDGGYEIFERLVDALPDTRVRDRLLAFRDHEDEPITALAERYGASGYVVESVPLALHAACRAAVVGFAASLREIVEAGGDCDSIGAMAGQCFGAARGEAGLPRHLVEKLDARVAVSHRAETLWTVVSS